jgi:hypothetical protein
VGNERSDPYLGHSTLKHGVNTDVAVFSLAPDLGGQKIHRHPSKLKSQRDAHRLLDQ